MLVLNRVHLSVFRLDLASLVLFNDCLLNTFPGHVYSTIISESSWMECHQVRLTRCQSFLLGNFRFLLFLVVDHRTGILFYLGFSF